MEEMARKGRIVLLWAVAMLLCAVSVYAMPTREELSEVRPVVKELMAPLLNGYKAEKKTAKEVGDAAVGLAMDAKGEAAKYILLKGAIHYYALAKEFDRVADTLETMRLAVKDLPEPDVVAIAESALVNAERGEAMRLRTIKSVAARHVKAEADTKIHLAALGKDRKDTTAMRNLADAYVRLDDWPKALKLFAKLDVEAAIFELDPSKATGCNPLEAADYWWSFKTVDSAPYQVHAAKLYKAALDAGLAEGLKKTLAEKRIAKANALGLSEDNGAVAASPQAAERKTGVVKVLTLPGGAKMEMIYVEPGEFMMGCDNAGEREKPVHKVKLTKGFWLGKYEVTQEQWQSIMGNNPSHFKGNGNLPVERVSWNDTQEFIRKVNAILNCGARLPTEAEWEYACRAGTTGDYGRYLKDMAWFNKTSNKQTHPIGQKKPNARGFYDMHGNVGEWCNDFGDKYPLSSVVDPQGATAGSERIVRGGAWCKHIGHCRASNRDRCDPKYRHPGIGFRLCCSAE